MELRVPDRSWASWISKTGAYVTRNWILCPLCYSVAILVRKDTVCGSSDAYEQKTERHFLDLVSSNRTGKLVWEESRAKGQSHWKIFSNAKTLKTVEWGKIQLFKIWTSLTREKSWKYSAIEHENTFLCWQNAEDWKKLRSRYAFLKVEIILTWALRF